MSPSQLIQYEALSMAHFDEAIALWSSSEGICLSSADSHEAVARYLARNPGLSFVAHQSGVLIGAVMAGHDGRRGYLHHLAVAKEHRQQGIGSALVQRCLEALAKAGIAKTHLFVLNGNEAGRAFWQRRGWKSREDVVMYSLSLGR